MVWVQTLASVFDSFPVLRQLSLSMPQFAPLSNRATISAVLDIYVFHQMSLYRSPPCSVPQKASVSALALWLPYREHLVVSSLPDSREATHWFTVLQTQLSGHCRAQKLPDGISLYLQPVIYHSPDLTGV